MIAIITASLKPMVMKFIIITHFHSPNGKTNSENRFRPIIDAVFEVVTLTKLMTRSIETCCLELQGLGGFPQNGACGWNTWRKMAQFVSSLVIRLAPTFLAQRSYTG